MERRRKKRKKEIHAYRLVARHGREYEAGRERGGSVFKEEEERASPACSFKSDKCAAGNMTEKNNTEECVLETRRGKERGEEG